MSAHALVATAAARPDHDVQVLLAHIHRETPTHRPQWPGGWPEQAELALLDAVLSTRSAHGSPTAGVRRRLEAYRDHRGRGRCDDLAVLADVDPERLATVLGSGRRPLGHPKAEAVVRAAAQLAAAGARHAADLHDVLTSPTAGVAVPGLAAVTWEYLFVLVGPSPAARDTCTVRFVEQGLGRTVHAGEARVLLERAAGELAVPATDLQYAVWRRMTRRGEPGASA